MEGNERAGGWNLACQVVFGAGRKIKQEKGQEVPFQMGSAWDSFWVVPG